MGDGCNATCEIKDEIELFGTGQGGSVQVVTNGFVDAAVSADPGIPVPALLSLIVPGVVLAAGLGASRRHRPHGPLRPSPR